MVSKRRKIPGKERTTPYTRTFYMTDEDYQKIDKIAENLKSMGISGLYRKNGDINRSAVLSYVLEKFDRFLERQVNNG